jgi:hypothetical protein
MTTPIAYIGKFLVYSPKPIRDSNLQRVKLRVAGTLVKSPAWVWRSLGASFARHELPIRCAELKKLTHQG